MCVLEETGLANNTIVVIASDNGGSSGIVGSNFPHRGSKGSMLEGGVHNRALIVGPASLIPTSRQGQTYTGLVHMTDWFPTFAGLASRGKWKPGGVLDGFDVFGAIVSDTESPRREIFHNFDKTSGRGAMQIGYLKLIINGSDTDAFPPEVDIHLFGQMPRRECDGVEDATLLHAQSTWFTDDDFNRHLSKSQQVNSHLVPPTDDSPFGIEKYALGRMPFINLGHVELTATQERSAGDDNCANCTSAVESFNDETFCEECRLQTEVYERKLKIHRVASNILFAFSFTGVAFIAYGVFARRRQGPQVSLRDAESESVSLEEEIGERQSLLKPI